MSVLSAHSALGIDTSFIRRGNIPSIVYIATCGGERKVYTITPLTTMVGQVDHKTVFVLILINGSCL